MLRELHISNLAVIEDLTVELGEGLNCFTGQTGAGKSLILGAFEILLGLKSAGAGEMIRPGAEEARISGVFELHDNAVAENAARLLDITIAPGDPLLITRKFFASGRSSVSVNGQPATAAMVREIGELLVDIHGQHDHQYLLKPSNQLTILDGFAKATGVRARFAEAFGRWRDLLRERGELTASQDLRRQQLDLYEFQAQEIDAASPQEGEYAELKSRHAVLTNLERIRREASQAYHALYETEGAIVERLQMVAHVIANLTELDPNLAPVNEQIKNAAVAAQEGAFELNRYTDRLELDPKELAEVEDRMNALNRLIAKYGSGPAGRRASASLAPTVDAGGSQAVRDAVDEVIAYRAKIGGEIDKLRGQDSDLGQIEKHIAEARADAMKAGQELSKLRREAAKAMRPLIETQMRELGMAEAEFDVEFQPAAMEDGSAAGIISGGASGLETIEMLVRTNPGQPARPLRKIASGGELSRIMLAIKSILAQSDRVSVLVFDEIDANIGGRMGTVIGQKLRALAHGGALPATPLSGGEERAGVRGKTSKSKKSLPEAKASPLNQHLRPSHQVICITHLPQIAAYADRHLRIAKAIEGAGKAKQTRTTVTQLAADARVEELAEMLAGKSLTDTTRKQVREMLEAAR